MKKIICSIFLLIFSLCLVGCEQNQDNSINLHVETFEVEESIYDNVCKEYNIEFRQLYYVIDNYGTYLQLPYNYSSCKPERNRTCAHDLRCRRYP